MMNKSGTIMTIDHALALVVFLPLALGSCTFPDYLQSHIGSREWRGHVKSQYKELTQTITFNMNKMSVSSTDSSDTTYDRMCIQALSDNTFIVAHEQNRQRSLMFVCLQIIKRSDSVIQIRESNIVSSMAGVCDNELHLDPWILVDKHSVLENSQSCPLVGGFSMKLFDKEYQMGFCDAYKDHVWMESECVAGSGLYFNFRYSRCIPNIFMSSQQHIVCLASWTEGGNTFVLIRHDTQPYMWIMRYPTDQQYLSSFVSYLMKDLYASTKTHITETDAYVQIDMVRDIGRPVSSLCTDEFEGCDYYSDPCAEGGDTALTCARTCGVCNETRPLLCNFDNTWLGDWIDAAQGDRVAATFERKFLTIHYNREKQIFHCVHWDEPYIGPVLNHTKYKMLVTEFADGCRPQYSCVKIVHRASSPVMFLQLSSERHWPFTGSITEPINCNNFEFDGDTNTLLPNRYRSKHYRLLYRESMDTGTTCNMPPDSFQNHTVMLSDGTQCNGWLRTSTSGSSISVRINDCNVYNSLVKRIARVHTCIESSSLFASDLLVVSRTDEEPYQLYCWLFPRRTPGVFYLVESAHCNAHTKRRISRGHLLPLAVFSGVPLTTTSIFQDVQTTPQTQAVHSTRQTHFGYPTSGTTKESTTSDEHSIIDITLRDVSTVVYPTDDNSSSKVDNPVHPASYASPIVIVAAVILFVVFQIPCMCKAS